MGILLVLKTFPSFATLLVADEKPTQAQRDTGATHNYKLIFCWTMEAITNYFYGNNSTQEIWRVGMNKIGTAHVLLSDSIHTLPIEEENDGRSGLCESWSATGVSSLSTTVVLLHLASVPGSRSETVEDDAGEETPCTTLTVDQLQCGVRGRRWGRCAAVDECTDVKGRSTKAAVPWRSLFCGGDRKWGVFRCTTMGAGVGLAG